MSEGGKGEQAEAGAMAGLQPAGRQAGAVEMSHVYVRWPPLRFDIPGAAGVMYDDGSRRLLVAAQDKIFSWSVGPDLLGDGGAPTEHRVGDSPVLAVRFSLDGRHLALQRSIREIEVTPAQGGPSWRQACQKGASRILGFFWAESPSCDIVFVTSSGLELYALPQRRGGGLRAVDSKRHSVVWYAYTHESRLVLLATGPQCTSLTGYQFSASGVVRIPKFDAVLTKPASGSKPLLAPEDVSICTMYGRLYCVQVDKAPLQVHLFRFYRDAVVFEASISIYSPSVAVSVVDNSVLIHQTDSKVVLVFDTQSLSSHPLASPLPLTIRGPLPPPHEHPGPQEAGNRGSGWQSMEPYGEGWVFVTPGIVLDHERGVLWKLRLDLEALVVTCSDRCELLAFLQNRRAEPPEAKRLSAAVLCTLITEHAPLPTISRALEILNSSFIAAARAAHGGRLPSAFAPRPAPKPAPPPGKGAPGPPYAMQLPFGATPLAWSMAGGGFAAAAMGTTLGVQPALMAGLAAQPSMVQAAAPQPHLPSQDRNGHYSSGAYVSSSDQPPNADPLPHPPPRPPATPTSSVASASRGAQASLLPTHVRQASPSPSSGAVALENGASHGGPGPAADGAEAEEPGRGPPSSAPPVSNDAGDLSGGLMPRAREEGGGEGAAREDGAALCEEGQGGADARTAGAEGGPGTSAELAPGPEAGRWGSQQGEPPADVAPSEPAGSEAGRPVSAGPSRKSEAPAAEREGAAAAAAKVPPGAPGGATWQAGSSALSPDDIASALVRVEEGMEVRDASLVAVTVEALCSLGRSGLRTPVALHLMLARLLAREQRLPLLSRLVSQQVIEASGDVAQLLRSLGAGSSPENQVLRQQGAAMWRTLGDHAAYVAALLDDGHLLQAVRHMERYHVQNTDLRKVLSLAEATGDMQLMTAIRDWCVRAVPSLVASPEYQSYSHVLAQQQEQQLQQQGKEEEQVLSQAAP